MSISRRRFLITTGLSAAGAITASSSLASKRPAATQDWSAVRSQFDLARDYIHLSSFFLASHPRIVRDAIERHKAAIDNNPFLYVERQMFEMPGK
ncbi:MAG TPA: aminotransferase class V-fold PLP-dependent enzyme, partial [Blastocatellia bacterium]|nr:aminotransferase class V-fold PLP-dependent enzyme [Blastocatellia bacterium]